MCICMWAGVLVNRNAALLRADVEAAVVLVMVVVVVEEEGPGVGFIIMPKQYRLRYS